jgi:hypothetical protein
MSFKERIAEAQKERIEKRKKDEQENLNYPIMGLDSEESQTNLNSPIKGLPAPPKTTKKGSDRNYPKRTFSL